MGKYSNSYNIWKTLGSDTYTKVRTEVVGTGDGSTSVFDLEHDNVISGSTEVTQSAAFLASNFNGSPSENPVDYYEAGGIYNQKPYYSGLTGSKYIWANPSGLYLISPTIGSSTSALYNSTTTGSVPGAYQSLVTGTCSVSIYTGSSVTFDYDDGTFSFASAPPSGSEITVDYSYTSIPDSQVQSLLNQSDEELEDLTARNFDLTTTSEYIDVEDRQTVFWLRNYPVVSMIGLSENTANSITDSPSWSASTEGIGNDYLMDANDKLVGTFEYIDNKPIKGSKRLYATYSYGYATIPDMVVELNNLLTLRKMINSTIYKSIYTGQDGYSPVRLDEIENRINALVTKLRKQGINRI